MSIWFRRVGGLNTDVMRKAANDANVTWDANEIQYKKDGIGFVNGNTTDTGLIQTEIKNIIGFEPIIIDEPEISYVDQPDQT
jgi:hypothetical protein